MCFSIFQKLLCGAVMGLAASAVAAADCVGYEVRVKGTGCFRLLTDEVTTNDLSVSVAFPGWGHYKGGVQNDEHEYISYAERMDRERHHQKMPPFTPISNCVVHVEAKAFGVGMDYLLLPYFHSSYGLYSHQDTVKYMPEWLEMYPLVPEREITFRFMPDLTSDATQCWIDGSLAGLSKGRLAITGVADATNGLVIVSSGPVRQRDSVGMYELPPLTPRRTHALLRAGATLSVGVGEQVIAGVPLTVWDASESLDQGRHAATSSRRNLTSDPSLRRTPWQTGPEFLQWRVAGKHWRGAWILCADIPAPGRRADIGTRLSRLGEGCTHGNMDVVEVSLTDAIAEGKARSVGTLTYRRDDQTIETPLYLLWQPLDVGRLGARAEGATTMDFEFIGCGSSDAFARSSVQIFGCTLVEAPFGFRVANPIRGNIFEGDDERKSVIEIKANANDVKGSVAYEVYDPLYQTLEEKTREFSLAHRGDTWRLELDFTGYPLGWYGVNYVFRDAEGQVIARHEASFTCLAADDREAGYESPFACWPHSNGYHGSNPNPTEQREVMRKAGYRSSWEPPCVSEEEVLPQKITKNTAGYKFCQPDYPMSREALAKRLTNAVEAIRRDLAAFPHCRVIQLLHEQGGREMCREVATATPGVRGEYRGWDFDTPNLKDSERGDWEVFYCTEFARTMRREFPQMKIMIGNGSSSSEKIASLCRRGFDLSLVDQLGIESKGFGTMPELCANMESPGMLWALRETARLFGYSNLTMNACNEYVFRTERRLNRTDSRERLMEVADFTVRDYLISMAHGCSIISTGHLEDAADAYYDTNWGAGGQCTAYPYSYPKRMFTALAVLSRVLDCATYQRMIDAGERSAFVMEFLRTRQTRDFAYALWTPQFGSTLEVTFPKGTQLNQVSFFGLSTPLALEDANTVRVEIGSSATYLIASAPMTAARVVAHAPGVVPSNAVVLARPTAETLVACPDEKVVDARGYWGIPPPMNTTFAVRTETDPVVNSSVAVFTHTPSTNQVPPVVWEGCNYRFTQPIKVKLSELKGFALWIRGNGAFGKVKLLIDSYPKKNPRGPYEIECGNRGYVTFDGWQCVTMDFSTWVPSIGRLKEFDEVTLDRLVVGTTRVSLDPIEMRPSGGEFAIGPIYGLPKDGVEKIDLQALDAAETWQTVPDKDR